MTDVIFIYATFPNEVLATRLANSLLSEKLIACANVHTTKSIYLWEGKMQKSDEAVAIFKTQKMHYSTIEEKIRAQHDYKIPCIVELSLEGGYPPFLNWVLAETSK